MASQVENLNMELWFYDFGQKNQNELLVPWIRRYFWMVEFPLIEITVDLYEGILITTSFACWVLIVSPSQSKIVFSDSNSFFFIFEQ